MRRLTHEVAASVLAGEKNVGSPSMAKRKSADAPSAGVADVVAETPRLGVGVGEAVVPHALAIIATAASSPIARRVRRLMESSSCIRFGDRAVPRLLPERALCLRRRRTRPAHADLPEHASQDYRSCARGSVNARRWAGSPPPRWRHGGRVLLRRSGRRHGRWFDTVPREHISLPRATSPRAASGSGSGSPACSSSSRTSWSATSRSRPSTSLSRPRS